MSDNKITDDMEIAYVYDPEEWDATYEWADRDRAVVDDCAAWQTDKPKRVCTLIQGPDRWAVSVPISWTDAEDPADRDVDDWELQWFNSKEEALAAVANAKPG